jgi:hypothetical protein
MYPHRIRLRGPWVFEPLARLIRLPDGTSRYTASDLPAPFHMNMPGRWRDAGLLDFAGKALLKRRFGLPRRLDANERVWLTFAGAHASAKVSLNGQALGEQAPASGPFEFQVTELLGDRNELVVEIESSDNGGGLWGEVALEIRCLAFLRDLRAWTDSSGRRAVVEGLVVGEKNDSRASPDSAPLEIYVLHGRRTVGYAAVTAARAGRPFRVTSEEFAEPAQGEVLVQLVQRATIWYETACRIGLENNAGDNGVQPAEDCHQD